MCACKRYSVINTKAYLVGGVLTPNIFNYSRLKPFLRGWASRPHCSYNFVGVKFILREMLTTAPRLRRAKQAWRLHLTLQNSPFCRREIYFARIISNSAVFETRQANVSPTTYPSAFTICRREIYFARSVSRSAVFETRQASVTPTLYPSHSPLVCVKFISREVLTTAPYLRRAKQAWRLRLV